VPDDLNDLIVIDRSQIKPAAETLSQAFHNYPVSLYACPDAGLRNRQMPFFFRFILYYCQKYGEVYTTSSKYEGVAAWLSSDTFPVSMRQLLRAVPLSIFFRTGWGGCGRMKACGEYFDSVHKKLIPYRHWFLQMIGVKPEFQGKGYGARLIRPVLERIDKQGLACYLETQDTQDVPIYEHYGFRIIDESLIPGTDLISRAMLREPVQR
jgi:ribosomal protein S18 acetylase RimI-like enzyme